MEVIRKGKPYWYYDLECPKCHSIVRVGESELHYYEDCYDTEMAETDHRCPNCMGATINVPVCRLENYRTDKKKKTEVRMDLFVDDADKSQEQNHRSVIEKLWNRLFHKPDKEVADLTEEIYKKKLNDYGA